MFNLKIKKYFCGDVLYRRYFYWTYFDGSSDEEIRNQVTTNDTLTAFNNHVIELGNLLKYKSKIIESLEYKINSLEQNEKLGFIEICGVKIKYGHLCEKLVHNIVTTLEILVYLTLKTLIV